MSDKDIRPIPRISLQAFCETEEVAASLYEFGNDRRMSRAHIKVHGGGIRAAIEFYEQAPTPNVIIVESALVGDELMQELDLLANVCDADTRVIIIGRTNDVEQYRRLIRFGVSEYMVSPISVMALVSTVGEMFGAPDAEPLGRSFAFVGAKGGCGSSVFAQNIGWMISEKFASDVIIADFDLAGGTVGLNFDQEPPQGIREALFSKEKLDEVYLDRLLSKCTEHLNLLASPATLDRTYEFQSGEVDSLIELAQRSVPFFIADLPYQWTDWLRKVLITSDEVIITATPDLAGLRNAKNMFDYLVQQRKNDPKPHIILNQTGKSKETEIQVPAFEDALGTQVAVSIPFDPGLFGMAMNNGQMIGECNAKSPIVQNLKSMAAALTGRTDPNAAVRKKSSISFLDKLRQKAS